MSSNPRDDFLSGESGNVWGVRASGRALALDVRDDLMRLATALPLRLKHAAGHAPDRRVLAVAIEREDQPGLLDEAEAEFAASRHLARFVRAPAGRRGKWENIDTVLQSHPAQGHDWLLVVDDDVRLPRGFLDAFVFLAEHFGLKIAQPAHRARSHAAWQVTRRRPGTVARQTCFVESGPVVGFHKSTFETLLPFPRLRAGWGLDGYWSAIARDLGWRVGVLDAIPVRHSVRRIAAAYDRHAAIEEAQLFLADRPYVKAVDAQKTLATYRRWD